MLIHRASSDFFSTVYAFFTVTVVIVLIKYCAVCQSLSVTSLLFLLLLQQGRDKAVPLQAWSGPEGSMKLRFPDFMTTAQDGVKVVSLTHRPPLPPGNTPGTYFC